MGGGGFGASREAQLPGRGSRSPSTLTPGWPGVPGRGRDGAGPMESVRRHSWPRHWGAQCLGLPWTCAEWGCCPWASAASGASSPCHPGKLGRWVLPSSTGSLSAQPLPFPSVPGEQMAMLRLSSVGGQAGRMGGASGKSWQPLVPRSQALSGFQEVTFLPLHREPLCVCIPLCPQIGPLALLSQFWGRGGRY